MFSLFDDEGPTFADVTIPPFSVGSLAESENR